MIDPADKQTQAIPLDEQPTKKRRGRPATGKAMTPAEKQRAYRERQKGNVTEKALSDGAISVVLNDSESTAIVCLLQDKAREISTRALHRGPVTPEELNSARWLSELAHRIATIGRAN